MLKPLIKTAKTLRKRSTDAEILLWRHLRTKQLEGLKFRRQEVLGKYIVDFVCFEKKIIIEVDGGQHLDKEKERGEFFIKQGYKVLRFWNNDVLTNIKGVLEVTREDCLSRPSHPLLTPSCLPQQVGEK